MQSVFSIRLRPTAVLLRRLGSIAGLWAALLLAGGPDLATAQTPLRLLHQVEAPGQNAFEGSPLPPGTAIVVLRYSAERAHALETTGMSREKLSQLLLDRLRARTVSPRLTRRGKTRKRYPPTAESDQILYVLARTPSDTLYETYVNTGDGFVPGFDAVQSGRMAMGPVPETVRPRYRAVLRVSEDDAPTPDSTVATVRGSAEKGSGNTETGSSTSTSTATARTAGKSSPTPPSKQMPPSAQESTTRPVWWGLVGVLLGGLIGGGAAWWAFAERLKRTKEERDKWRRRLRETRSQRFREATGTTLSPTTESETASSESSPIADLEQLQEENDKLREQNEALQRRVEEIKEVVQELREQER